MHLLVVGDVMYDVFLRGDVERISPEAPVPVVRERSKTGHLGGAANTAANIASLGGRVTLVGVVGNDEGGKEIVRLCRKAGIEPRLVTDPARMTATKTRIAARHHQLVRVDRESEGPLSPAGERRLMHMLKSVAKPDMVVISDYGKGVVTKDMMSALRRLGGGNIVADIKPRHAPLFRKIRAITPNIDEAEALTGIRSDVAKRAAEAARTIAKKMQTSVVLTRGEHGMTVCEAPSGRTTHIPSDAKEVFDVTGAGDTVVAALALALSAGEKLTDAARFANRVAGIAVGREGTATVSAKEVQAFEESGK